MKPSPCGQTVVLRSRPSSPVQSSPWLLVLCLALAGTLLGGCGSDQPAEATAEPATLAPTEAPAPTQAPPTEAATATAEPSAEVPTAPPTALPATRAPQQGAATGTATVSAATVASTAAPAQPSAAPTAAAAPAGTWSVEFYPDNWTYQLTKDQLCAGVNWKTVGVTELRFGSKDSSGEAVEAVGSRGNLCFKEDEAEFFLEYRKPDGQLERKTLKLERDD